MGGNGTTCHLGPSKQLAIHASMPLSSPPALPQTLGGLPGACRVPMRALPTGAQIINLGPETQQEMVTVWMDGQAYQAPAVVVKGP